MSAVLHDSIPPAAQDAVRTSVLAALSPADGVSPQQAWALFSSGAAVLVDVRTAEERSFVGYVPDSLHVACATGTSLTRNPRFVRELEAKVAKDKKNPAALPQRQAFSNGGGSGQKGWIY